MPDLLDTDIIQAVKQAEQRWTNAFLHLDIATLEAMMAQDYVQISPQGETLNRTQVLASLRSGKRHWQHAQSDEWDIRVYGDTALVIGRWQAAGVNNDESFDYAARFTSLYVKRDGTWQMVLDHSTPIPYSHQ